MRTLLLLLITSTLFSQSTFDQEWQLINAGKHSEAREQLLQKIEEGTHVADAAVIIGMLDQYTVQHPDYEITEYIVESADKPSAYISALWGEDFFPTNRSFINDDYEKLLKKIAGSSNLHSGVIAEAEYHLGLFERHTNDLKEASERWEELGCLKKWAWVGPFHNVSGSGHEQVYGPEDQPESDATFKSQWNSDIKWFEPSVRSDEPWLASRHHIANTNSTVYAQTFVYAAQAQNYAVKFARGGAVKFWINDALAYENDQEYKTDMDYVELKYKFNRGWNRLVVKLSTSEKTSYPYFAVRLLDQQGSLFVPEKQSASHQKYTPRPDETIEAEERDVVSYFSEKVKQTQAPVHYIILASAQSKIGDYNSTIRTLKKAQELYPKNVIISTMLWKAYSNIDDLTKQSLQLEYLRDLSPDFAVILLTDYFTEANKGNYLEAGTHIERIIEVYGRNHPDVYHYQIQSLANQDKVEEVLDWIREGYKKYPSSANMSIFMSNLVRMTKNDLKLAIRVLEKYQGDYYSPDIENLIIQHYDEISKRTSQFRKSKRLERSPYLSSLYMNEAKFQTAQGEYEEARSYLKSSLEIEPYNYATHESLAYTYEQEGETDEAIKWYQSSLKYNPNNFSVHEKLLELKGLSTFKELLISDDLAQEMTAIAKEHPPSDYNYDILKDETYVILFDGGSYSEYNIYSVRVNNESGIDHWKESSIGYGRYQSLTIEDVKTIKPNGERLNAERNHNEIVFTSLEPGDILLFIYRLDTYRSGELSDEFWTTHAFDDFKPTYTTSFNLYVPEGRQLKFQSVNFNQEPEISNYDKWMKHSWSFEDLPACDWEEHMPSLSEVGKVLHVSSLDSWSEVSEWYSRMAYSRAEDDYNVDEIFNEIFSKGMPSSAYEKGKLIYQYICDNLTYSLVDFRQSAYVPQKPLTTLSSKLGDCKDFSVLFHTLGKKAGIDSRLTLVLTRFNGENNLVLPSIGFDHCIVQADLGNGYQYIELTDKNLPFGRLPNSVQNAQALVIPKPGEESQKDLTHITSSKKESELHRSIEYKLNDNTLAVNTRLLVQGTLASDYRSFFEGLSQKELDDKMKNLINTYFDDEIALQDYSLKNLEGHSDSLMIEASLVIHDPITEIGGISAIKPEFFEHIAYLDDFPDTDRDYPISYWRYEEIDVYNTTLSIDLGPASEIIELPGNLDVQNDVFDYQLRSKNEGSKITISRRVNINRKEFGKAKYSEIRDAISRIDKVEDKYIAFKN